MSTEWKTTIIKKGNAKARMNSPVLIEGMPGIGNVGKIAADMLVEQLKAERIASFFSYCLPNSVFVKDNNLVELPKIELFHKKIGKRDFLFLLGDVQPMDAEDSYNLTEAVLGLVDKYGCKEIIALGGIGLQDAPEKPKLYCTGNDEKLMKEFVALGVSNKLYGFVGPVMGVTGLLLGLSAKRSMRAAAILTETSVHPMHIGLREAKELMGIIEKKYKLGVSLEKVEKNIKKLEQGIRPILKQQELGKGKNEPHSDTSYIG